MVNRLVILTFATVCACFNGLR